MTTGREIHLASRANGTPTLDNFAVVDVDVPDPTAGQVQVRNLFLSVDPYMRGRMNAGPITPTSYQVGHVLGGGAVGEVTQSESPTLAPGDIVLHTYGWREWVTADAADFRKVDPGTLSPSVFLGALGMPGLSAYVGLFDVGAFREGDAVFVSGAAGGVGSVAGQLARLSGASRVVGSAGTASKVAWLVDELGFDAAFCYRDGPVAPQLQGVAPDGIDLYFDNVGGEHLEAAIGSLRLGGRAALCGGMTWFEATPPPGPRNMMAVIGQRLTIRGFIVGDHQDLREEFESKVGGWLAEGKLTFPETVLEGLERTPDALIGMLRGDNVGKMLVRVG
jgi:NADPH-dependent curcumin reductase CurA